ncbi:hypothetical protein AQS8620_03072 [Aquimixticola soesokkakensis]|uniref:Uncharacterized protein n=1 Tax=Aquimixticola soesokkakensis TaxID=1519096 RepID=A0A1Y5TQV6_9RHOB|nr:hypothetical protein [Aquimixticola soesokkakensis]SLN66087.1 hypothetical protein AQS8620_03072 [Aquimixticola soesokkakensis]
MTDRIAIGLGILLILLLFLDGVFNHWAATLFMARRFTDVLWWVAFWR